ncbi:MAG: hypothetical protein F6K24_37075 [Okeania sp. SIO2D1]|nr:hypothetical protein [Okeania sp. SIO2D1]
MVGSVHGGKFSGLLQDHNTSFSTRAKASAGMFGIEPIQFAADSSGRLIKDYGVRLLGDSAKLAKP